MISSPKITSIYTGIFVQCKFGKQISYHFLDATFNLFYLGLAIFYCNKVITCKFMYTGFIFQLQTFVLWSNQQSSKGSFYSHILTYYFIQKLTDTKYKYLNFPLYNSRVFLQCFHLFWFIFQTYSLSQIEIILY